MKQIYFSTTFNKIFQKSTVFLMLLLIGFCHSAQAVAPNARTVSANRVTYTSAWLNCIVNAQSLSTTISFEYGLTNAYGSTVNVTGALLGNADSFRRATLTGLAPHKTYYYRVKAVNVSGTTYGKEMRFITGESSSGNSGRGPLSLILDDMGIVYATGLNGNGQLGNGTIISRSIPTKVLKGAYAGTTYLGDNLTNPIIAVASGESHCLALAADGTVYSFGENFYGQLGDNTLIDRSTPIRVLKGGYAGTTYLGDNANNPIISISAGLVHSIALAKDGTVYTFGFNGNGQLGDNTIVDKYVPMKVLKGAYAGTTYLGENSADPIISIYAGSSHNMVLSANGLIYTFGFNTYGQLGDGTSVNRGLPTKVVKGSAYFGTTFLGDNPSNRIISIVTQGYDGYAISDSGYVYSFGAGLYGQLGIGSTGNSSFPVRVLKGLYAGTTYMGDNNSNRVIAVYAGPTNAFFLTENNILFSVGGNGGGGLGDGTTVNKTTPVRPLKGAYGGTTYLGDNAANPIVSMLTGTVISAFSNINHVIAIAKDGYLYAFGNNLYGQLGDSTLTNRTTPVRVRDIDSTSFLKVLNSAAPTARTVPATRVTFTSANLNAIVNANVLETTVSFEYGLTTAYGNSITSPGLLLGNRDSFRSATISNLIPHRIYHFRVIAINALDTVYGDDRVFVTGGSSSLKSNGALHSIFLDSTGAVYASGVNGSGQLGDGTITQRYVPVRVLKGAYPGTTYLGDNPANPIVAVTAGYQFSLALAADGTVYSFGLNNLGQLGDGTTVSKTTPVKVLKGAYTGTTYIGDNAQNPIISISAGRMHSVLLAKDGGVYCFGGNATGALGDNTLLTRTSPVRVLDGQYPGTTFLGDQNSNPIIAISAGYQHTVALSAEGKVYATGLNDNGQLGDSSTTIRQMPIQVLMGAYSGAKYIGDNASNPIVSISAGSFYTLFLTASGAVYGVGRNLFGHLGDNTTTLRIKPVRMSKGAYSGTTFIGDNISNPIVAIAAFGEHCIVLASDGFMYGTGFNAYGQLGDNTTVNRTSPVRALKGLYGGSNYLGDNSNNPIVALTGGNLYSTGISADGYILSYGNNATGQFGNNDFGSEYLPVYVHGVGDVGLLNVLLNNQAPSARTVPANRITFTSANLNAIVNANVLSTSVSFEYGLTTAYGSVVNVPGSLLGEADSFRKAMIMGLTPHKTYHFRVRAINAKDTTFGADMTFVTGGESSKIGSYTYYSLILDSSGIVYAYGYNNFGQLGDGTSIQKNSPVKVLKGAYPGTTYLGDNPSNPIITVAQGFSHSLALAADGTVYSFGNNIYGQLGNGTLSSSNVPVLATSLSNIVSIAAGLDFSIALSSNGIVYSFGHNIIGQLGDSTTTNRSNAVQVKKGQYNGTSYLGDDKSNPIIKISCSQYHFLALSANGTVYGVGSNGNGQLGDNTLITRTTAVKTVKGAYAGNAILGDSLFNPIIGISTSVSHSLFLAQDGTIYATGANSSGQLGDGTNTSRLSPIRVLKGVYAGTTFLGDNIANPIRAISTGVNFSSALAEDGQIYTFGFNNYGQLGDSSLTNRNTPVKVKRGAYDGISFFGDKTTNPVVSISSGGSHIVGITEDGYVFGLGGNVDGNIGDNTIVNKRTPVFALGVGNVGYLNVLNNRLAPSAKTVPATRVTFTSATLNSVVNANLSSTTVSFEYGLTNAYGSVVNVSGTLTGDADSFRKATITGLIPHKTYYYRVRAINAIDTAYGQGMRFITGGENSQSSFITLSSIVLDSNGIVYTMGQNSIGELGNGTLVDRKYPIKVLKGAYAGTTYLGDNPNNPIIAVASGALHHLALAADGTVYSFGYNVSGQLGDGTTSARSIPVKVLKGAYSGSTYLGDQPGNPIIAISSAGDANLALGANGTIYSFGYNFYGGLGDGTTISKTTPVRVIKGLYSGTAYLGDNPSNPIIKIASGNNFNLAIAADGQVYGFGRNNLGQLGDNTTTTRTSPVKVVKGAYSGMTYLGDLANNQIISISCGIYHSMALAANGTVFTFGYNVLGGLGDGTTTQRTTPVRVLKGVYTGLSFLGDNVSNPIISMSCGLDYSLCLASDGTMYGFGDNSLGNLGDGTITQRNTPVRALKGIYNGTTYIGDNLSNPIVRVTAGSYATRAITENGNVYSFGYNIFGQLGDGSTIDRMSPIQTLGVDSISKLNVLLNYEAASARTVPANRITFTSARLNALVNANGNGATVGFEYGLTTSYGSYISVPGILTGIADSFKYAEIAGLLPHKTYHFRVRAVNIADTTYGVDRIFVTGSKSSSPNMSYSSVYLDSNGIVYATGRNVTGQLGDGTTTDRNSPIRVLKGAYDGMTYLGDNPINPIVAVAAGLTHTIALAADGTVFSFGSNGSGELGDSTLVQKNTPIKVKKGMYNGTAFLGDNPLNPIIGLDAGTSVSHCLASDGTLYSFGENSIGSIGDSILIDKTTPIRIKKGAYSGTSYLGDHASNPIIAIASSGHSFHALVANGTVYSFGYNFWGQLGDGTTANKIAPVRVVKGTYSGTSYLGDDPENPIISIARGSTCGMALSSNGRIFSFGENSDGQLGNGTFINSSAPVGAVKGVYPGTTFLGDDSTNPVVNISAGYYHSLALTKDGSVYAYGSNTSNGQLGDGTLLVRNTPVRVLKGNYIGTTYLGDQTANPIVSIHGGWFHSCAIAQDGFVYAWGQAGYGQLGNNSFTNKSVPSQTRGVDNYGFLNVLNSSLKPNMIAVPANNITYTSATLNTLFNPNNLSTTVGFEYGLTTAYGDSVSITGAYSGTTNIFRKSKILGLLPHKTYHYRAFATNAEGTSYSEDRTFITGSASSLYSSSGNHTLILDSNGIVYAFGDNTYGQLGDSSTANRILPIRVKKGAYNGTTYLGDNPANPIIAVSAGENHSMALAADGTVFSFGLNTYGQLGIGTTIDRLIPTKVIKGIYTGTTHLGDNAANPIIAISCGTSHSLALASDGTVFSFGYNSSGELGDNTITQRTIPTKVLKGAYIGSTYLGDNSNPMISIAASRYHSVALGADGMVYTFGRNAEGQLGDATLTNRLTPVRTVKGEYIGSTYLGDYFKNPITAIAANDYRTMVLAADGTVFSFGYNGNGQLGDNTTTNRNSPVRVLKGLYSGTAYLGDSVINPIVSISLGTYHSSALAANGRVFNFGANFFGQLGDGTTTQSLQPLRVLKGAYSGNNYLGSNNLNPIVSIASGNNHNIAIDKDGYVFTYGYNNKGQLGDSTNTDRSTPVAVRDASGKGRLNVFFNETLPVIQALPANRVTYTTAYINAMINSYDVPTTVTFQYGLSISYTEKIQIAGSISSNQLQRVSASLCNLIPGKTYHYRAVAINAEGTVYGPDQVFVAGRDANVYSGTGAHNFFVGNDGIVYGSGFNTFAQLGDSVGNTYNRPIKVYKGSYSGTKYLGDNPNNPIVMASRGGYCSIALAKDGTVYTVGDNAHGSLGDNTFINKSVPVKVLKGAYVGTTYLGDNLANPIISVTMGWGASYALALDGTVYSFGDNSVGQLGDSTLVDRRIPVRVKKGAYAGTTYLGDNPSNPIVAISASNYSFYALAADGQVYSMGINNFGQLGDGSFVSRRVPVKIIKGEYIGSTYLGDNPLNPIQAISAGGNYAMTLAKDGLVYTFGYNATGSLGDSTFLNRNSPVKTKKGTYTGTRYLGDDISNPIVTICAGEEHSMALTADNKLYAYGSNVSGELGDGSLINRNIPIRVLKGNYVGTTYLGDNPNNPILSIANGYYHSNIITADGKIFSMGSNAFGALMDLTFIDRTSPVKAKGISGTGDLDLIQCNSFSSIPTVLSATYTSQHSDTDAAGWRHYCTIDNQLLLSLKIGASGAVISDDSVRLKLAATTTMSSASFGGMITNVNGYAIFERRWDVKPTTQPSSAVGIKYYFTPKEYSDLVVALANLPSPSTFTNVNQLTMYKATSGAPFADPHTVPGVLLKNGTIPNQIRWKYAPHGNCNHSAEYNVASFSGGGGGGGGGGDTTSALLPVELLSFKGQWSEDDAILTWVTASERNSDRFEVERSIDGINFTKVGTVKSKGNSTEVLTYMFNDVDAGQAKVDGYYYRLKQVDFDGAYDYAQIIYLRIDKKSVDAKVIVFPNPFVSELQVVMPTSSNSDVQIQIAGVQGAMILNYMDKVDQDRRVKINTELLPAGVFILNVTQDGITSSHKIIKE